MRTANAGFVFASLIAVAVLAGATYGRNAVWHDEIRLWEDTVKKSPGKAHARYNLGVHYEATGRREDAAGEYQAAITLDSTYFRAHNNLGNLYLDEGRLNEALAELQIAARLKPESALVHDNLGYLYFSRGMIDNALMEYVTALKLSPDTPEIHNDIGYVSFTQGRYEKALEEYQTALRLKPDFNAARANIEKLHQTLEKSGRAERAGKRVNARD